jgi:hypothetical protein
MKNKKDLFKYDLDYIEMAKAAGVYGTDWHNDLLEFAYMVAEHERKACYKLHKTIIGMSSKEWNEGFNQALKEYSKAIKARVES